MIPVLQSFRGYRDSGTLAARAAEVANVMKAEAEKERVQAENKRLEAEKEAERQKKLKIEREEHKKKVKEKNKKTREKVKTVVCSILIPLLNVVFLLLLFKTDLFREYIPACNQTFKYDLFVLREWGIATLFDGRLTYYLVQLLVVLICFIEGYCVCNCGSSDFFGYSYYFTYVAVVIKIIACMYWSVVSHSDTSHLVGKGIVFIVLCVIAMNIYNFWPSKKKNR